MTIYDNSQQKNVKYESHLKTSRLNRETTVNSYFEELQETLKSKV